MGVNINREFVENLIKNIASEIKLERLKRPFSMLSPEPFHFPQFSRLEGSSFKAQQVLATGLEVDALYEHYGMPRDVPQMVVTLAGSQYGQEFADFTIEMFGLKGNEDQLDDINRLAERNIGNANVSNADPDSLPFGAGMSFSITDPETEKCVVKIHVWRWRVFMNNSSLCLENNWQTNKLTGGGWIPYILGIVYGNPAKMVEDTTRFAPAFKLCNLVEADLSEKRGGHLIRNIEGWTGQAIETMALKSQQDGRIIPYSFVRFSNAFPLSTSRQNVYNLLTQHDRDGLESRYLERCAELMTKPAE